jgi:peroxiredoxin Q/BCP
MVAALHQPAPDFELPDHQGEIFQLSAHRGQPLLLLFYPGDNTPVCTAQWCDYRDGFDDFKALGVEVVGISRDSAESHRAFRKRHQLPFPLLTDADLNVTRAYGIKGLLGMKRALFVLDAEHCIRYRHVETVAVLRRRRDELLAAIADVLVDSD